MCMYSALSQTHVMLLCILLLTCTVVHEIVMNFIDARTHFCKNNYILNILTMSIHLYYMCAIFSCLYLYMRVLERKYIINSNVGITFVVSIVILISTKNTLAVKKVAVENYKMAMLKKM